MSRNRSTNFNYGRDNFLYRKYNDRVCGDEAYWSSKRQSRYGTFIELLEVQAVSAGPAMPRSRGCAWFVLDEGRDGAMTKAN